jgi:uncharacterized metal-binding protein YceD (DUF177 family)
MSGSYSIPVSGLKEGRYYYNFEIGNEFFDLFEEADIKEGNLRVAVDAERRPTHVDLTIRIKGVVSVSCNRCLGMLLHTIDSENRLLIKFGKVYDDSDPDILTIPADEHSLDLKQYFYEYIVLALPIQIIHPDDEEGNSTCDPVMLSKLKEHAADPGGESDHRWDELRRFINNN